MADTNHVSVLLLMCCLALITSTYGHGDHHRNNPSDRNGAENTLRQQAHDKHHIKEHYDGEAKIDEENMTDEELEFHFFKQHDHNNDTRLDGLEILKAITHMMNEDHDEDKKTKNKTEEAIVKELDENLVTVTGIIDRVLLEDDLNRDGYLSYGEYFLARRKDEKREQEDKAQESQ